MADEELTDFDNDVHVGGTGETRDHKAAEAIYPCMALTAASTDGTVKPANGGVAGENFFGVAGVPEGNEPTEVIEVGEPVPVYRKGSGSECWMFLKAVAGPIPVSEGDIAILSSTDGQVELADESAVAAKAGLKVGIFQNERPGHATDRQMVRVKI